MIFNHFYLSPLMGKKKLWRSSCYQLFLALTLSMPRNICAIDVISFIDFFYRIRKIFFRRTSKIWMDWIYTSLDLRQTKCTKKKSIKDKSYSRIKVKFKFNILAEYTRTNQHFLYSSTIFFFIKFPIYTNVSKIFMKLYYA